MQEIVIPEQAFRSAINFVALRGNAAGVKIQFLAHPQAASLSCSGAVVHSGQADFLGERLKPVFRVQRVPAWVVLEPNQPV